MWQAWEGGCPWAAGLAFFSARRWPARRGAFSFRPAATHSHPRHPRPQPHVQQNKMNINDWSAIQTLFDKLHKQADKAQKALGASAPPRVYIKQLAELEVSCGCRAETLGLL